jgi:hypothetical protein
VRSAPEEQIQDASDAGNLQTDPASLSIANPGARDQNPIVTEEGFSQDQWRELHLQAMFCQHS